MSYLLVFYAHAPFILFNSWLLILKWSTGNVFLRENKTVNKNKYCKAAPNT